MAPPRLPDAERERRKKEAQKKYDEKRKSVAGFRPSEELREKLETTAKALGVSQSSLITNAIASYLEALEKVEVE